MPPMVALAMNCTKRTSRNSSANVWKDFSNLRQERQKVKVTSITTRSPKPSGGVLLSNDLKASALVTLTTRACRTSRDHQSKKPSKRTTPVRALSSSSIVFSMSRCMPNNLNASCKLSTGIRPEPLASILSKMTRNWASESMCRASSPLRTVSNDFMTCFDSSSTNAHRATPRITEPGVWALTEMVQFLRAATSCARWRVGLRLLVRPCAAAVRPVGNMMTWSTEGTDSNMSAKLASMASVHSL
mmetsp:Transcript_66922/g.169801  ORF Transcript_66922/g.169801 Transcript_66922/m.169801 type:complete len:244 (-) Transcript_66922:785-1516(-)